jgi:hypothetical protein
MTDVVFRGVGGGVGGGASGGAGGGAGEPFASRCIGFIHGCRCQLCAFRRIREKEARTRKKWHAVVCRRIILNRKDKDKFKKLLTLTEFNDIVEEHTRLVDAANTNMRRRAPGFLVQLQAEDSEFEMLDMVLPVIAAELHDVGIGDPTKDPPVEE